VTEKI